MCVSEVMTVGKSSNSPLLSFPNQLALSQPLTHPQLAPSASMAEYSGVRRIPRPVSSSQRGYGME